MTIKELLQEINLKEDQLRELKKDLEEELAEIPRESQQLLHNLTDHTPAYKR